MSNKRKIKKRDKSLKMLDSFTLNYLMHFGDRQDFDDITCLDCEDLKTGVCSGQGFVGDECLACMERKVLAGDVEEENWGFFGS
jgi:hypothetical protein